MATVHQSNKEKPGFRERTLPSEILDSIQERLFDKLDMNKDGNVCMDDLMDLLLDHHRTVTHFLVFRHVHTFM